MSFKFEVNKPVKEVFKIDVGDVVKKLVDLEAQIGSWIGTPDSRHNTLLVYKELVEAGVAPRGLSEDDAVAFVDELVGEVISYIEDKGKLIEFYFIETLYGGRADSAELYEIPEVGYALIIEGSETDLGAGYATVNFFKTHKKAKKVFREAVEDIREEYRGVPPSSLLVSTTLTKSRRKRFTSR